MADITLHEVKTEPVARERVSMAAKKVAPQEEIKVEKKEVSSNIQKFDQMVAKKKSVSPYDYNSISMSNKKPTYSPTADTLIADPTYNTVAKVLGVDTVKDWNKQYDKVKTIVDWAREKSKLKDTQALVNWIVQTSWQLPSFDMNTKRIDQLHMFAQLQGRRK